MTIPVWMIGIIAGVVGVFVSLVAWLFRLVVFDAISQLRDSRDKLGERIGRCETRQNS